ncbi:MAG: formimidoylglutamase [Candidatus Neomarinimicrobiota bacterium]
MPDRIPHTIPPQVVFPQPLADPGDPRLKHRIQQWDGGAADAVLVGMPFDHGVLLNHGRPGAAEGPTAFRQALMRVGATYDGNYQVDFDHLQLADVGDVAVVPEDVATSHDRLTAVVETVLAAGAVAVVIGGGHDATFATVRALQHQWPACGGLNVDAHLDMREVVAGRITSGTPYRRILEELHVPGENLVELGLHGGVNSRQHLEYAAKQRVACHTAGRLNDTGWRKVCERELDRLAGPVAGLFVSIDLDVFPAAHAPGVSAPGLEGPTPAEGRQLANLAGCNPKVRLFELMELNPKFDIDERTARLAASLLAAFLAGLAAR